MSKRKHFKDRDQILAKANNQCEMCGSSKTLHLHHKDLDKSNNSSDNAQVVCKKCHSKMNSEIERKKWWDIADKHPWETFKK